MKSLGPEGAVVVREEGETTVALAEMDRESRVRCDQEFRDKIIEFKVKKDVRSIQPQASP